VSVIKKNWETHFMFGLFTIKFANELMYDFRMFDLATYRKISNPTKYLTTGDIVAVMWCRKEIASKSIKS